MKVEIPPCSCSQNQWQDTPTPSTNKEFVWNTNPKQDAKLKHQKELYEELQDQTQRERLEREGEINWYRQQNNLLYSKLKEFQDNEDELWNYIDCLQNQLEEKEQEYIEWRQFQTERLNTCCQVELKLEALLTRYKKGKASWEQWASWLEEELTEQEELSNDLTIKINQLKKELNRQSQANRKKKKKLKQTSFRLQVAKQDKQNLQDWKDDHVCSCQKSCCSNNDYDTIKQERNVYQTQLEVKDQKIVELETKLNEKEQELREKDRIITELSNKPPLQPLNNSNKSEIVQPTQAPNNFLTETQSIVGDQKEELLKTIRQQKTTIQELQSQLSQISSPEPQTIVKEVPVENLVMIKQLQAQLKSKEQSITQLHLVYLLLLGVSILFLTYLARVIKKKNKT
jgi:hypothetical protein